MDRGARLREEHHGAGAQGIESGQGADVHTGGNARAATALPLAGSPALTGGARPDAWRCSALLTLQRVAGNRAVTALAHPRIGQAQDGSGRHAEDGPPGPVGDETATHHALIGTRHLPAAAVQLAGAPVSVQRARPTAAYVHHQIHVTRPMTQAEFRAAAMRQVFGGPVQGVTWQNSKGSYEPANSPYPLRVSAELLKRHRGEVNKARGISVDENGRIAGAEERAKGFHAGPETDEKSALMNEVDRRYFEAVGDPTGTKIKNGEKGNAELWRTIRDEVLFQHEYISKLPAQVKALIKVSVRGKELTPADYDRLFAIAKKIEQMPAGHVSDYASKVRGSTTDLDAFESSLDAYTAAMTARAEEGAERDAVHTQLIGLEKVYEKYKLYRSLLKAGGAGAIAGRYPGGGLGAGLGASRGAEKVRKELDAQLRAHGFAGITGFEAFIRKFEKAFERESVHIAQDLLKTYGGTLYRESERYQNPTEVAALHSKLGGVRTGYRKFSTNAKIWNDYVRASQQSRLPGQGHLRPTISLAEAEAARDRAEKAKAAAQSQIAGMSDDHPIFQEEGLPLDKRINKKTLASANENELGPLLQAHIKTRVTDVDEASAEIDGKPELIYTMDKLMPRFYAQQGIRPGSIHDQIIRDKMREDAIVKLIKGLALALVAVALAVVTFGAATPGIIAAGAAAAGAGLGAYMALEEYQEYATQQDLADVGFADDPSLVWLVLAVVGAGLDMAAAIKAVKALGPAAKALNAGGELSEFTKAVKALEQANELEAKVARAAEKAAAARKGFTEASSELTKAMSGKLYSFPGPLADPDVYKAVVKMARQAIRAKVYDAQKFIEELRLARVRAGQADLAPEELAKAKEAWEEAKVLEAAESARYQRLLAHVPDATKLDALIAQAGDTAKLERLLQVFPAPELEAIFVQLTDTGRLVLMIDHVGAETAAGMIRKWMVKGKSAPMNEFLKRLASGTGKELAETSVVGAKSLIIDSQTAIALAKDADPALRATMNSGEKARVAYIKALPGDVELRVGNVTVGEVQGGVLAVKGVPIDVARSSPEYQKVLAELEKATVGKGGGFADRGLLADAFFAKVEPGVTPRFLTADQDVAKKLARLASIDVNAIGGYPGLLKAYGTSGFNVIIEHRALTVIPVP